MRYFPNNGYTQQPTSIFESSAQILPGTILAICYDATGIDEWALFDTKGNELSKEDLDDQMYDYIEMAAKKQAAEHLFKHSEAIEAYIDDIKSRMD
jgi:hypothetical protein